MRALLVAAAVVGSGIAGAAVAVLLLGGGAQETLPQLAGRPAAAEGTIEPRAHLFGDAVTARAEVLVDRARLDPGALRLQADFEPYEPVAPVHVRRRELGELTRLTFTVPLRCLKGECVPPTARRVFEFRPGAVVAGEEPVAQVEWPEVEVTSRITQSGLVSSSAIIQVDWRANMTELPAATYRVAPTTAAAALAGLAGVLVAAASTLVAIAFRRPPPAAPRLPPLERALVLLEAARRGDDAEEERKALDLLAAELARRGEGDLARAASTLAWSRPDPAAEATETLSDRVGRLVEQGRNGDGS